MIFQPRHRFLVLLLALNSSALAGCDKPSDLIGEHLAAGGMAVLTSHQPLPVPGGKALVL